MVAKLRSDPTKPIGQYLQSLRRLVSAEPIELWTRKLATEPVHFVSYRISDGSRGAFRKVHDLIEQRKVVFWDRWSLPRGLAERREIFPDPTLDQYLMEKLEKSAHVWGIESKKYSAVKSYSEKERSRAMKLGIPYHGVAEFL
jgi:hypothetical protein